MRFHFAQILCAVLLATFLLPTTYLFAQDRKLELENTKKRIEEEINYTSKLLEETRKSKQMSLNELTMLQSRIRQRENLVATIQKQLIQLETQLTRTRRELNRIESELEGLKKEYARMIAFAYKNRSGLNKMMFLFSADDFNQAYRRLKYLQQYSAMRQKQIDLISEAQSDLKQKRENLEKERAEKTKLFEAERREQILLSNEKMNMDLAVKKIGQQEGKLQQTLRQKEQDARKLQREIEAIIAEEIRKARQRQGEKDTGAPDRLMSLTPEEQRLSNSFTQNRGKLPWPVERGVISSRFGEQPHPVLKKVTIKNNGIDIATTKGSEARAVFDGVVVSTNRITASNNAVIIRHGDYFSVYSNLEQVYVKRGDKISTKQSIGLIHTEKTESKTELHFEIWQNRTIVDPALWLAR
ncbi:MAG: peptidoglycan DD-metalloendopeptidase family protein [Bacteroidetes bacterium]|jgi:murein hydrolase activator|nr:peptidoglycan DD-metalloendopeptidase family protein [Bacteroidota bacterium]